MYTQEYNDVTSWDTQVNDKIKDYPTTYPPAGSSAGDIDDILNPAIYDRIKRGTKIIYPNIQNLLEIDLSSIHPHFRIKNETSSIHEMVEKTVSLQLSEEEIVMEMVDHDIITGLPPKRRYKVELRVRNIRRGKPKIVNPEDF